MFLFKTEQGLRHFLEQQAQVEIGFVPTMGALHQGHISLLKASQSKGCLSVASIFVNPTQFNDAADLEKYPRPIARDLQILYQSGCDVVFCPSESEIYKPGKADVPEVDLGALGKQLEATFRPGHFEGVMQVVKRLLMIVQPHFLFMGQKDLQQIAVIKKLIQTIDIPVNLVACPIVRAEDGLALSSRNERLDSDVRPMVPEIFQTLDFCRKHFESYSLSELKSMAREKLDFPEFRVEYIEFVNPNTMEMIEVADNEPDIVMVVAVWAKAIRLIDNMIMRGKI